MKKERTRQFKLDWPIEVEGGDDIAELTLTRPKSRKALAMGSAMTATAEEQAFLTVTLVTGLSAEMVEEIDGEDFVRLLEEVADFLPQSASRSETFGNGAPSSLTAPPS
jgi:hypothetical protein